MNVIIVFSVVILCAPVSNVYADDDSDYTVKNSEALKIFNELNQEKQAQKRTITQSNESTIEKITNIASSSYDLEKIYTSESDELLDIIVYDNTTDTYILLEQDNKTNKLTLSVDNETVKISADEDLIQILSKSGETFTIYEEIIDESYIPTEQDLMELHKMNIMQSRGSWGKNYGPFHKTTKMVFEVLSLVNTIVGGFTLKVSGPIGVILFIFGVAVDVGSTIRPTIHLKYYHQFMSDCQSYVRETRYHYGAYSEISNTFYEPLTDLYGNVKYNYTYFHSLNPGDVGGACLGYN